MGKIEKKEIMRLFPVPLSCFWLLFDDSAFEIGDLFLHGWDFSQDFPMFHQSSFVFIESFLCFRNNRVWTNLYRRCKEAANKVGDLRKTVAYLQNVSIDVRVRINSVLRGGSYYVRGMGKNLATAILHVCDKEDKYGVWNNRTEGGLQKLDRLPRRTYNKGEFYYRINVELNRLKKELDTDLIIVDSFMWYVNKFR